MNHECFFTYDKEASTDSTYIAICRKCGKMQVTKIPLTNIPIPLDKKKRDRGYQVPDWGTFPAPSVHDRIFD